MIINTTYGLGGYCENCTEGHDHPLYNIIEQTIIEETITEEILENN